MKALPYQKVKANERYTSPSSIELNSIKQFDQVMLQRHEAKDDMAFAQDLKMQLMQEISGTASTRDLEEIKLQLASDTYQISFEEIVRRMMY